MRHLRRLPEDVKGMGTSPPGPDPRGARARRRPALVGWSSLPQRQWMAGDDLAERGVEPIGHGGTTVGDAANWSRVAAKADPSGVDHQLGAGESLRLGIAEQVSDEFTDRLGGRLLRSLDARGEGRDASLRRAHGNARELRRGL